MGKETHQHVLLVTPWDPHTVGGVSATIESLSNEFRRMEHQVTILVTNGGNRLSSLESISDVTTFGLYLRTPYFSTAPLRSVLAFSLFLPATLWQVGQLLRRQQIGLVLIQYPLAK